MSDEHDDLVMQFMTEVPQITREQALRIGELLADEPPQFIANSLRSLIFITEKSANWFIRSMDGRKDEVRQLWDDLDAEEAQRLLDKDVGEFGEAAEAAKRRLERAKALLRELDDDV